MRLLGVFLIVASLSAEPVFEDSPALTSLWEATSTGSTDRLIDILIQNREYAHHRSSDGRGPMFWAMEFKNVDAYAILMHLEVKEDSDDLDGKVPRHFFDGTDADFAELQADAKAKIDALAELLAQREEEFYSYRQAGDMDDYDEEDEEVEEQGSSKPGVDKIDYADEDEEDEDALKDEM
jgi:hypothetical protein